LNLFFAPLWVFSLGIGSSPSVSLVTELCYLLAALGGQEHGHEAAFQLGILFHGGNIAAALGEVHQQLLTEVGVRHFAATKTNADLHTVAIAQELLSAFDLGVEIVGVDTGAHANLFDFHNALVLLGFLFTLLLIEAELGVVHDFADRGNCVGRDLYKIHALLFSQCIGLISGHDAQLGTVETDEANLFVPDLFVELMI